MTAESGLPDHSGTPPVASEELLRRLEGLESTLEEFRAQLTHRLRPLRTRLFSSALGSLFPQRIPRRLTVPGRYRRLPSLAAWPLISVVTPMLNAAAFVEATLRSVLEQGYARLEYIVQDGGSTDQTLEIIGRYAARLASVDSRRDAGQSEALNLGFRRANGEIMAYLNGDDLLLPGALHYVAWFFARHPDIDVVYGHRVLIDEEGWEIGRWVLPRHDDAVLSWADYVPQETLFWRRGIWEKAGAAFDETFQFAMDWELLLRFRDAGARFARVPRFLGAFRVHRGQKTSARMGEIGSREMARLRQRVHGQAVAPEEIVRGIQSYLAWHALYQRLYAWGLLRY
jgi:hypothetical protein